MLALRWHMLDITTTKNAEKGTNESTSQRNGLHGADTESQRMQAYTPNTRKVPGCFKPNMLISLHDKEWTGVIDLRQGDTALNVQAQMVRVDGILVYEDHVQSITMDHMVAVVPVGFRNNDLMYITAQQVQPDLHKLRSESQNYRRWNAHARLGDGRCRRLSAAFTERVLPPVDRGCPRGSAPWTGS